MQPILHALDEDDDDGDGILLAPAKEAVGIVADPCGQTEVTFCRRRVLFCLMICLIGMGR